MNEILNKKDIRSVKEYEEFVSHHKNGNFMQSVEWTGVKKDWDSEAVISRDSNGKIRGTALVLIRKIPFLRCSFLYSPHGPVCDYNDIETLKDIFEGIEIIRKKYKGYELIVDPCITENDREEIGILKSLGFGFTENAPELTTIQARNNYILRINSRTQDEIFQSFHKKWRYNIRVASRKGVECRVCGTECLDDFYGLMEETGKRDGFCIRSKEYFRRMMENLGEHCRLYMCYYKGVPLSGAIATQYAGKTCYVYGASTAQYRNVMPNYLMQWTIICWAVENKCDIYDFQGIPFYKDETHPNYGVYRFKRGFNGEVLTYAGEFVKCYNKFYSFLVRKAGNIARKIFHINPARLLELGKNSHISLKIKYMKDVI
ncbi:lipid II:glycine glycyltransferase FemX [Porcipelethomonas sp.]|uniref:lipid II:glycine glycyltransferase FemX n=1 Tax=Porcipelethomonas sp. TaxID=2981675 RepID=UPI003EF30D3F